MLDQPMSKPHRHRHIEGYFNQVPENHLRVGYRIGNCKIYNLASAHADWRSMSRIVIEEVSLPQT